MSKNLIFYSALSIALAACSTQAESDKKDSPQASTRNYLQNYKDMVLAECVATAYRNDTNATKDAGSSVSALRDWSYYDFEQSIDATSQLISDYLARDYRNPLVETEIKNVKFDFLKCLDLYHSNDLEKLAKQVVINPDHSYHQDQIKPSKEK
ncbi:hypothetical protein CBP51_09115 [Cellvibrio mixtus]|uniref:Type VI secretion protein n=1 Tax=Cellvibrio mixtus TaxID=39650 RepID=A0A266QB72_9GAMM|nr:MULTISPECIES: type VI secretion system amidase immunity protein Tai4 [Cellvibrio]AQT60809.1 hypothetical protein B0D95_12500 [Cellvibrio sp. PSBB023]OZY87128.1 hypothetical protein CBP51_09115 [Cellvibrio mixtus]